MRLSDEDRNIGQKEGEVRSEGTKKEGAEDRQAEKFHVPDDRLHSNQFNVFADATFGRVQPTTNGLIRAQCVKHA
jgi:hypothetical protein